LHTKLVERKADPQQAERLALGRERNHCLKNLFALKGS
jgi:hypothetical protein